MPFTTNLRYHEYLFVLPLVPMRPGTSYVHQQPLPLHCTLMPWFPSSVRYPVEELTTEVRMLTADWHEPLVLVADARARFGPRNTIPVTTIARNERLECLHTNLFAAIIRLDSWPENIRYVGAGYRPHITDAERRVVLPGQKLLVREIALVGRRADTSSKEVVETIQLGS